MKVQKCDVDFVNQQFKVVVKKGGDYREVLKPIKGIALPLWKELMYKAAINDYLFSDGLIPGEDPIRSEQVTRRWKRHIKDKLGVKADLYSLRHLNVTEMMDILSDVADERAAQQTAMASTSHKNPKMIDNVYDVRSKLRKDKRVIAMNNKFA